MRTFLKNHSGKRGFTLIELLIVIGIIGILATIVLVAVDPVKRLRQARDARKFAEVNAILNAILNYTVDNKGTLPSDIDSAATNSQIIGTSNTVCGVGAGCDEAPGNTVPNCADLTILVTNGYIAEIPIDPLLTDSASSTTYDATRTGYYVNKDTNGRIEVGSCNPEDTAANATIKVKR